MDPDATRARRLRHSSPRRGRTAILSALAVFAVLQLAGELALRLRYPHLLDEELGAKLVGLRNRLAGKDHPLLVVAFGSSRVEIGFNAGQIEAPLSEETGRDVVAYSLAVTGGGPVTQRLMVRRALAAGIRPDLVVLEAFVPHLVEGKRVEGALRVHERLTHEELLLATDEGGPDFPALVLGWWSERPFPLHRHRVAIQGRALPWLPSPEAQHEHDAGWAPWDRARNTPEELARALEVARRTYVDDGQTRVSGHGAEALVETLRLLEASSIPSLLVVTPVGPAYRSWFKPGTLEALDEGVAALASACHVPLANARLWTDVEEDFVDSHHLSVLGVEAFTDRLAQEFIQPVLARGRTAEWTIGVPRVQAAFEGDFGPLASTDRESWHPCGRRGTLVLLNRSRKPRRVSLDFEVAGSGPVSIAGELLTREAPGGRTAFHERLVVPPGRHAIAFSAETPGFRVVDFGLGEEAPGVLPATWGGGFSWLEGSRQATWRWCGHEGRLTLSNASESPRALVLEAVARGVRPGLVPLQVSGPLAATTVSFDDAGTPFRLPLLVPPGEHTVLFRCDAPRLDTPDDPRTLVFRLDNARLLEADRK